MAPLPDVVVPSEVETLMAAIPNPPGATIVIVVPAKLTVPLAMSVVPKFTVDPGANPAPLIVTTVPPVAGPESGVTAVTTGI